MSGPTTRKTLLAKIRSGDEIGWREFYCIYKGFIYDVAQNTLDGHGLYATDEDFANLIHDVMCDLVKPEKFSFDPARGKFRTWFSTVIKNKLIDLIRHKMRRLPGPPAVVENEEGVAVNEISMDVFDPIWNQQWSKHRVTQGMQELRLIVNEKTYLAFEMQVIQDLSPREVAQTLKISVAAAHLNKHRCLKRLKTILACLEND